MREEVFLEIVDLLADEDVLDGGDRCERSGKLSEPFGNNVNLRLTPLTFRRDSGRFRSCSSRSRT